MNFHPFAKQRLSIRRRIASVLLCLTIAVLTWQGIFVSDLSALASPAANWVAAADLGDKIQEKVGKDTRRAKDFVQDTQDRVKKTAQSNANKVERATDDETDFIGRKAKKDQGRIEAKADNDSARTQKAINRTEKAVKRTVENIKDSLGG
jgi:hypothetical protein